MKKALAIALAAALALGVAGCGEKEQTGGQGKASIWSAPDTEKVLQDREYDGEKGNAAVSVVAVRNEYEGAQLLMTAETDVSSYTVQTAALTGPGGASYAAENVEVFNEKYIDVTLTTTNSFSPGSYPDALLPFETAVSYGENRIAAGENQGIYFSFYIPEDQAAGTYTGSFTLTIDGVQNAVPVTLRVIDYTLDDEVHSRSSFGVHRYWNEGGIVSAEKDASYEMYAAYYEYLLEHRISTRYMPAAMSDTEGFIAQLRKYAADPRCSNYIIPYVEAYDSSFGGTGIDYGFYEATLDAIAQASAEDNVNYLEKASTYFAMFDEITSGPMITRANSFYRKIYELHGDIADKWESSLSCSEPLKSQLIDTLLSLNQLMVTTFDSRFDIGVTWCPLLDKYNTESSREQYAQTYSIQTESGNTVTQNAEKWWYSAGIPKNPYPSYHIDDNGYSPVVYSWMQYAYGVTGNLYWSATFYLERVSENGSTVYNALQDCYDTACAKNGRYFQLADVLGVDEERGLSLNTDKYNVTAMGEHFIFAETPEPDYGEDKKNIYALEGAQVLKMAYSARCNRKVNVGEVKAAVNEYGKGRSFYVTGLPYTLENARLLYRALLWVTKKEDHARRAYSENPNVDCHFYEESGKYALVNNAESEQETVFYDMNGNAKKISLAPMQILWL